MSNAKKMLLSAAGSAGGGGLDITDVFSTFLNNAGSSNQVITNGIDLAGEGGLVFGKSRNLTEQPFLVDSARGKGSNNNFKYLRTTSANGEQNIANRSLSSFNSNGFTFQGADSQFNASGNKYVYWTFRKAPKFFDIVTYEGNNETAFMVNHNLGVTPGMIVLKAVDSSSPWFVWHRGLSSASHALRLNLTNAESSDSSYQIGLNASDTQIYIDTGSDINYQGTYIAYLFAHNDGDGEFGPDADQDIIKCGNYTGNGSATGPVIDLGFEPQFVMVKNTTQAGGWQVMDSMRGIVTGGNDARLQWNVSDAEASVGFVDLTSTGFQVTSTGGNMNGNTLNYIYMAIRRGPLAPPTAGTEVYSSGVVQNNTGRTLSNPLGHPSDLAFTRGSGEEHWLVQSRLTGIGDLKFDVTNTEVSNKGYGFGNNTNYEADGTAAIGAYGFNFRRAPSFFDVVAYSGTNSATTISHNLTVAPEMMWVKSRANANRWTVFHKDIGPTKRCFLDLNQAFDTGTVWNNTAPSSTVFSVGTDSNTNSNGHKFIAYLFASLDGISKVGSVSHSNTTNVDCGFSNGARFVMLKRSDATGDWYVWDSVRGIVAGNDPYLLLNTNAAEVTNTDFIDPLNAGFTISDAFTDGNYIFYAIA